MLEMIWHAGPVLGVLLIPLGILFLGEGQARLWVWLAWIVMEMNLLGADFRDGSSGVATSFVYWSVMALLVLVIIHLRRKEPDWFHY